MEGVPGVKLWTQQPKLSTIQKKAQKACNWTKNGFPGGQPISMDRTNLGFLKEKPYKVLVLVHFITVNLLQHLYNIKNNVITVLFVRITLWKPRLCVKFFTGFMEGRWY